MIEELLLTDGGNHFWPIGEQLLADGDLLLADGGATLGRRGELAAAC